MKYRIKDTKTTTKVIGIYQIIGGIAGIGLMTWVMLKMNTINNLALFILIISFLLFGFSVLSGMLLLKETNLKKGLILSSILQALQILSVGIGKYSFLFYSGAKATFGIDFSEELKFTFETALSSFEFNIKSVDLDYFININFLAIILLSILLDIFNEKFNTQIEDSNLNNIEKVNEK